MKRFFIILTLSALAITLNAQNRDARRADGWFARHEYRQAAADYNKAIQSAQRSRANQQVMGSLYSRMGETQFRLREYLTAETYFVRALEAGTRNADLLILYGKTLLANDKQQEAMNIFRQALELRPGNEYITNLIRQVEFNLSSMDDPRSRLNPVEKEHQLNIAHNQYGMNWYRGALMFSCDRVERQGAGRQLAPSHFFWSQPVYDFRFNEIRGWAVPEALDAVRTDEAFAHSFAHDPHTNTYYVTRCLREAGAMQPRCNIFAFRRQANGRMSDPVRQSFHRRDANIGHPTLSSDGRVMFFTTTVDGDANLYVARRTGDNTWTTPLSLGPTINTPREETYPHLFGDSILFFSSSGHPGMGGLDIFYSQITVNGEPHAVSGNSDLTQLRFSEPVNMGYPINSGADDVSFLLKKDKIGGFFISNRQFAGQNRNIIYSFENIPFVFDPDGEHMLALRQRRGGVEFVMPFGEDTDKSRLNRRIAELNSKVFDHNADVAKLNERLAQNSADKLRTGADIPRLRAIQDSINNERSRIAGDIAALNDDIERLNAEIVTADNRNPNRHNDPRWILDDQITRQNAIITRQNAEVTRQNAKIALLSNDLAIVTDNLLVLDEEISILEVELDKLNEESPIGAAERARLNAERERLDGSIAKLRQERAGHRDQLADLLAGRSALEQEYVGQSRELVDANDEISRLNDALRRLGGGTDEIIARLNDEIARLRAANRICEEELARLRAANRACEEELARLRAANRACEEELARLRAELEAKPKEIHVEVPIETFLERAVPGEILILRKIFFATNSTEIRAESFPELNRFAAAMRNSPNTRIEVSGHTDVIGTRAHNQWLSEARAKAVRDYLISQGIPAYRMRYVGYNFTKPIATNETPEGRAQNRRVEIKIID